MIANTILPPSLVEQIIQGQCVLFLGNDMPLGFPEKAPPSSAELTAELAQRLTAVGAVPHFVSLTSAAQYFAAIEGRQFLVETICDLVQQTGYHPTPVHQQIAALPFKKVLITGYDTLLEEALKAQKKSVATISGIIDAPYSGGEQVNLYYLNGNVRQKESLVITYKDRYLPQANRQAIINSLRFLFQREAVLFLNYQLSLEGDEFQGIFHEATYDVFQHRRQAYIAWPKADPILAKVWEQENLHVIDADASTLLDQLAREIENRGRRSPTVRSGTRNSPKLTKAPYKFLDSYTEDDADIFFGRSSEILRLWQLVLSERISVLFGPSGAGKSSLVRAGLFPRLTEDGYQTIYVRGTDAEQQLIGAELQKKLRSLGRKIPELPDGLPLSSICQQLLNPEDQVVIVIDELETIFQYHNALTRQRFWQNLAAFHQIPTSQSPLDIRFLLILREDHLPDLDEARGAGLDLFPNSIRLKNLSEDNAAIAMTEPAAMAGLSLAAGLVQEVLRDLSEQGVISPPQLQIVCDRLYQSFLQAKPALDKSSLGNHITLADYRALGGAQKILEAYIDGTIEKLPANQREIARAILKILVSSQARKVALTEAEIHALLSEAGVVDLETPEVVLLIQDTRLNLQKTRLIRGFEFTGQIYYELAHDYMARHIGNWMSEQDIAIKLARELLRREYETWQMYKKTIERGSLSLIHENRHFLKHLNRAELELLLRSALETQYETSYWARRAADQNLPLVAIATHEFTRSEYRRRVGAVLVLEQVGAAGLELLKAALEDPYPQVRTTALQVLSKDSSQAARKILEKALPHECFLPAGVFQMGADIQTETFFKPGLGSGPGVDINWSEQPLHDVSLEACWIDRYPVTNADYALFLADDPGRSAPIGWKNGRYPPGAEHDPVTNVNWYDAQAYAIWAGKRLPTEAEWEKAARGGDGRFYPWGSKFDPRRCNSLEGGKNRVTPVGAYGPDGESPYHIADLCGNVWEWTQDWYDVKYYSLEEAKRDPTGPSQGEHKVLRGGSFREPSNRCRTFSRFSRHPDERRNDCGFRCAFSLRRSCRHE